MHRSLLSIFIFLLFSAQMLAQTVTYQGHIKMNGAPLNGTYDIELDIYNALTGGQMLFGWVANNVSVVNGSFASNHSFPASFITGSRWVEISIRESSNGAWTTLAPRQPLTYTPFAINSLTLDGISASGFIRNSATQQASSNFSISGNGIIGNRLGVGTSNPLEALHVAGNTLVNAGLTVGGSGFFLGQVGVGTSLPTSKLHVTGSGIVRAKINSDSNAGLQLSLNEQPGWSVATVSGGQFQIFNDAIGQNAFWINSANNNVGIGTAAPQQTLHVNGNEILSTGPAAGFKFRSREGTNDDWIWYATGTTGNARADLVKVGGANLLTVFPNGIVRIPALTHSGFESNLCVQFNGNIGHCSSSQRFKTNIQNYRSGLSLIDRLRPVTFESKENGSPDLGLVAEEVATVEPLLVTSNDKGEIQGVKYDRVGVAAINAIKEQQVQIKDLRRLVDSQNEAIKLQQQQIDRLRRLVCASERKAAICQ